MATEQKGRSGVNEILGTTKPKKVRRSVNKTWGREDVKESLSELKDLMLARGNESGGQAAPRIRMLMLLKAGAAKTATQAQAKLGISWPTVSAWLKAYAEGGVDALLTIGQGGREGYSQAIIDFVRKKRSEGVAVKDIVALLEEDGHKLSHWMIYNLATPDKRLWQCKTTKALDAAMEKFARSPKGRKKGGWYRRAEEDEARHNTDLIEAVVAVGAGAIIDGRHQDLTPRRSWGVPGSLGSHLSCRFDIELMAQIEATARPGENQNQILRRLMEAGLIELGFPPESEASWAARQPKA